MIDAQVFEKELSKENTEHSVQAFIKRYESEIFPFYRQKGLTKELITNDGFILNCRIFSHPNSKGRIILVTGYNESHLKYAELIYDLFQKGYSVYCYDHRGQGYSQKFTDQKARGYFEEFDQLVNDLEKFFHFSKTFEQDSQTPIYILAHSMGGAVTTMALAKDIISPTKVIVSSPLFGLNLGLQILEIPLYLIAKTFDLVGLQKSYAFGQKDCVPLLPFETNDVTNSYARFQTWRKNVHDVTEVQLGGPTFHWITEIIKTTRIIRKMAHKIKVPYLLMQAEKETVVCNQTQNIFVNNSNFIQKTVIEFSKHEILMEIDILRNKALETVFKFFS